MKKPLLVLIPTVVVGLITGGAVIAMKNSTSAEMTPRAQAQASSITDISAFSAIADPSSGTYHVRFSLIDKNNTLQNSDFTGELRFIDLENNTLFGQFLTGKASDFGTESAGGDNSYTILVDGSAVHTELATSPEVARAQGYLNNIIQLHGSQSVEASQANVMVQQTKQLAAESLTAIIDIQIPDGKTFTASAPVIG